jgi:subfamily B ATP-binding cassette protein MsbA
VSLLTSLNMLFRNPITIIIFLVILFTMSFKLTLFVLLILPLTGILIGRIGRNLRRTTFKGQMRLGDLMAMMEETLSGLRIIKAFNGEKRMTEGFERTNQTFSLLLRKVVRRRYLASPISEVIATMVLMVIMAYGGALVLGGSGKLSGEGLILYMMIFSQIIPPAKEFSTAWINIQKGLASVDRVDRLLLADDKIVERPDALEIEDFKESIEFRDVSFKYDKEYVLKNVSFTIRKGQTVALVGKSGSGKSTLVDLLPRFMDTTQGEVLIDGIPVNRL